MAWGSVFCERQRFHEPAGACDVADPDSVALAGGVDMDANFFLGGEGISSDADENAQVA